LLLGSLASLLAGLATTVGALPVLLFRDISDRLQNTALGFAAGVMLAASFFSLLVPSLEVSRELYDGRLIPAGIAAAGTLLGIVAIALLNEHAPHEHFLQERHVREGGISASLSRIWLFVIAITLHNFPEGLAVGVSFGNGDTSNGIAVATGIGLQNIPEGLAVAFALLREGYGRPFALAVASFTGLVEPVGGVLGAAAVTLSEPVLPWGQAFAAGAMLYVISHEIIPETHRQGYQNEATTGLSVGLVVMMFLDVTLG